MYEPASVASALLASGAQGLRAKEVDERMQLEKDFQAWQKERFGKEMEFKESEAERSGGQFEKTFGLQEKSFGLQEKQLAASIESNRIRDLLSLGTPGAYSEAAGTLGMKPPAEEDMYYDVSIPWGSPGQTKTVRQLKPEYAQYFQRSGYNLSTPQYTSQLTQRAATPTQSSCGLTSSAPKASTQPVQSTTTGSNYGMPTQPAQTYQPALERIYSQPSQPAPQVAQSTYGMPETYQEMLKRLNETKYFYG